MSVTITNENNKLVVRSPYHPDFPHGAKRLGGRWVNGAWSFDLRDADRVRELCRDIYGTDGDISEPTVTLRASWPDGGQEYDGAVYVAGRQVARARDRDSGAALGDGIIVLAGGFGSGGSRKNWTTDIQKSTVIEIRDVPLAMAEKAVAESAGCVATVEILDAATIDRTALEAEAAKIRKRLAEIQALLEQA